MIEIWLDSVPPQHVISPQVRWMKNSFKFNSSEDGSQKGVYVIIVILIKFTRTSWSDEKINPPSKKSTDYFKLI